eukprot:8764675-Heterocapsa_arctica.AAC.1
MFRGKTVMQLERRFASGQWSLYAARAVMPCTCVPCYQGGPLLGWDGRCTSLALLPGSSVGRRYFLL